MRFYVLPDSSQQEDEHAFKIVKVHPEDIAAFTSRHGKTILMEGNSITEVLLQFSSRLDQLQATREISEK